MINSFNGWPQGAVMLLLVQIILPVRRKEAPHTVLSCVGGFSNKKTGLDKAEQVEWVKQRLSEVRETEISDCCEALQLSHTLIHCVQKDHQFNLWGKVCSGLCFFFYLFLSFRLSLHTRGQSCNTLCVFSGDVLILVPRLRAELTLFEWL